MFGFVENVVFETVFVLFFLVGGFFWVTDWMIFGVGVYLVVSVGVMYKYKNEIVSGGGIDVFMEDMIKFVFIEVLLGVSFDFLGNICIGVGY